MRVLVCGSRTFRFGFLLRGALDGLNRLHGPLIIIQGGARGADELARAWCHETSTPTEEYGAEWEEYGKRAGPLRNRAMLTAGNPDLVLAFLDKPLEESRGTAHMVRIAREAGVRTVVVGVEDHVVAR